jgi:hypothetical protein
MKRLVSFLLLIGCTSIVMQDDRPEAIYGVRARRIMPNYGRGTKLLAYDTSLSYVYTRGNTRIFDFTWKHYSSENEELQSMEIRHRFVMVTGDSSFGVEFNNYSKPQKRRAPIDSLFLYEWICTANELIPGKAELTSSQRNLKAGTLREMYKVTNDADTNYISTCEFLFTDSLPWLQLPYNRAINKEKKMQLVRTTYKSESQFYKPFNGILDGYTATFEFTGIPVSKEQWDKLLAYFNDNDVPR